ncbi:MAG: class I SAM-dependent methyltransferase [Elusimicrobia bacterium]|nr:class I SAM-dependent methyltransferase [Elusimicrobiota bacterium]
MTEAWQIWADKPEKEGTLANRAKNKLPQMESTKQLVKLLRPLYKPGMRILDVGCNAGHYLRGILELDAKASYTGVDAYPYYINQAKEIYKDLPNASFEVKDVFNPLFPKKPFDITYCCNVLLHLPDFRRPLRNILESTAKVSLVRTLIGERATIVKLVEGEEFDEKGEPKKFTYQNTYTKAMIARCAASLGWDAEFIDDEFDAKVLASEHGKLKSGGGTRVIDGRQIDGNILFNWAFIRFTPAKK